MIVHKTMSLKKRKSLGYEGYLERALCNRRIFSGWCMPAPFLSRTWYKVTCRRCLKMKKKKPERDSTRHAVEKAIAKSKEKGLWK